MKAYENRSADVRPCVKCMRCHDSAVYENQLSCTVNPRIGLGRCLFRYEHHVGPLKKVAVIGGGPAGIVAALVAAQRGHDVTLYEKECRLGGTILFSDFISFKYPIQKYKNYLIRQIEKSRVKIVLKQFVEPDFLLDKNYDAVILAIGASPTLPDIPGVEHAVFAKDIFGREPSLGQSIIIVGGGQVGCETALHLADHGRHITIVHRPEQLASDASSTHRNELLLKIQDSANIEVRTRTNCTAITSKGILASTLEQITAITADTVILAAGMKPKIKEVDAFLNTASMVLPVGDCDKAANLEYAVHTAYACAVSL